MILPSICFVVKQCQHQWRSPLLRSILVINQRQLATSTKQKKDSKKQDNDVVVQSTTENQIEVATFKEKGTVHFLDLFSFRTSDWYLQLNKQQKTRAIRLLLSLVLQHSVVYAI